MDMETKICKFTACLSLSKGKGKVHPCTGAEVLYRLYGPLGE